MSDAPHPIDIHVGSRVRMRRILLGMSQEKLGDAVGVTFQQVQKYERGANRISASRLFQFACELDVTITYFFEDAPIALPSNDESRQVIDFINSRDGIELADAWSQIDRRDIKHQLLELIRAVGAQTSS